MEAVAEGLMADVVALDDATSQKHHGRFVALQAERERLTTSLRFASRVQRQLTLQRERPQACPICLEVADAVCVLPECFHCLCRSCLQRAASGNAAFRCPLCRTLATWTVTRFTLRLHRRRARQNGVHNNNVAPTRPRWLFPPACRCPPPRGTAYKQASAARLPRAHIAE